MHQWMIAYLLIGVVFGAWVGGNIGLPDGKRPALATVFYVFALAVICALAGALWPVLLGLAISNRTRWR